MASKKRTAPADLFVVHDGQGSVEGDGMYGDPSDALAEAESRALDEGAPWYVAQYALVSPAVHATKAKRSTKR